MERSERIGMIVSGGAHLGAILWLLLGGIFFSHDMPPPVATAEVSLMSQAQFDAMQAAAPKAATEAPPQPSLPEPPASEPTPPAPEPEKQAPPAPKPEPEPQPTPDASPDVTELSPPQADVQDTPPTPPTPPSEQSATSEVVTPAPQPKPADIVAPDPTTAPDQPSDVAPDTVVDTTPDPQAEPKPEPVTEAAAPKETGDVLKTEDNKDKTASAAPQASPRPKSKPAKPKPAEAKPAEEAPAATETAAAPTPTDTPAAAVNDALTEALAGEQSDTPAPGTGTAPSGPPMTGGEKDALVIAVKQCWNVGSLSTDALNTVVTIGVTMEPSGRPVSGSIRMVGFEGGSEASAKLAYEAGRRAILRCAKEGYPLPTDKYEQWKEVEITFDPDKMRMK
jgi:hypothetical protein